MPVTLTSTAVPRRELPPAAVAEMFRVFSENFESASREIFERDLADKNWVILLTDPETGRLQGFSTMALYEAGIDGRTVSVVYSGDTIIRKAYWGTPELSRSWIRTVLEKSAGMPQPLYWLLISSGYKTYRFLTVFFREFYPRRERPAPPGIRTLMDRLARDRFGDEYHPEEGIVRFGRGATPLREGIAAVTAERLSDPDVAFFVERNPGHAAGDELVCITQIHADNLTPAGRRMVR